MFHFPTATRRYALLGAASFLTLAVTSCDPDDEVTPVTPPVTTQTVYVVNEGPFLTGSGSVSVFSKATKAVQKDPFLAANGRGVGNILQSMTIVGDNAYLVANNSNWVEVVTLADFKSVKKITGLSQPRYLVQVAPNKAYLTEWQGNFSTGYTAGRVSVLDLTTNTVTKTIPVGINPEQLTVAGGKVYVANSDGNTLTVINPTTDAVEGSVTVPAGPKNVTTDASGNVWVLSDDYTEPLASLVRFSPGTPTQQTRITFPEDYRNGNLRVNGAGDKIYVGLATGVYQLPITATSLPATPLIRRSFYGLGIDPQDNTIYAGTGSFSADGRVVRFSATGAAVDSFAVGIAPNGFLFK
ncbi:DUF5074 domain-containing protein [Hymenobacter puniceus]|uniref:DUF5074 domain-containing protein n=1 Tax=Hymenobacter sp. BT190 TaxID=2763505 RepID=UPI00165102E1|nr:DUF5074 domain-containing protein [Hymenobacter sp. BT190]MBC6697078.1 hypothetical protein [Hymenobacter sp. BT190]